uniref:G-protein coupled receptors family 1 profile domain-containing protein n=2 Tax=Latimeria chalumnae TaxID=7897 RepID=H2ZVZ2_LATCH
RPDISKYSDYDTLNPDHNGTAEPAFDWLPYSDPLVTVACVLLLFGVPVNGLVIWTLSFRIKRNIYATYLLHLSISDCLFLGLFTGILITIGKGSTLPVEKTGCKVFAFTFYFMYYVRSFFLALISFLRCLSLIAPLWVRLHQPRWFTWVSCLTVWLFAGVVTSPFLFVTESKFLDLDLTVDDCISEQYKSSWKNVSTSVLGFFLPLMLIVICNLIMCVRIRGSATARTGHLYRVISFTTLVFLVCGFPFNTFALLYFVHTNSGQGETEPVGALYSSILLLLNSCFNPFLYICTGRNMRGIFQESIRVNFARVFGEEQSTVQRPERNPPWNTVVNTDTERN